MTFIQPLLFLALPLALLPLLIHLLNRLRYRTRAWAAIMFLIKISRSSTRHAKLREFLILLFRCLAIAGLILALTRPLAGGWLGWAFSPAPDTIIILLDRSASMEAVDLKQRRSKRARALQLLSESAAQLGGRSRIVLLDSVSGQTHEVGDAALLDQLPLTAPSDTATSLPAMLQGALDTIVNNNAGRTELWIASDLRKSDWQPESDRWLDLCTQLAALPQKVTVRLLAINWVDPENRSISVHDIVRQQIGDANELNVTFEVSRGSASEATVPLTVTVNGNRSAIDLPMSLNRTRMTHRMELARPDGGWGSITLPADGNARDNVAYFAYGDAVPMHTAVVSRPGLSARLLSLSAAPAPERLNQSSEIVAASGTGRIDWNTLSLLIWQESPPNLATEDAVRAFLSNDGITIMFPPTEQSAPPFAGLQWKDQLSIAGAKPLSIATWNQQDGPLANTASGDALPVANVSVRRYRLVQTDDSYSVLARYADGAPFLLRSDALGGTLYVCTTRIDREWSNLGGGLVLVPMIQRMLQHGARRLSSARADACGDWIPQDAAAVWIGVDSPANDYTLHAGVYRNGNDLLALNRPTREDEIEQVTLDEATTLFAPLAIRVWEESARQDATSLQAEIWRVFLYFMLIALLAEALLILPRNLRKATAPRGEPPLGAGLPPGSAAAT